MRHERATASASASAPPLPILRFRSSASIRDEVQSPLFRSCGSEQLALSLYPSVSRISRLQPSLRLAAPCSLLHALLPIAQAVKYWPSRVFSGPFFFFFVPRL